MYYLDPNQISHTFMWLWAAEPTNMFAVFLVRLSISLFFLRLVPPKKVHRWKVYRLIIWGTITGLIISDVFVSIGYFFQCRPIRKIWVPATPGTCFRQGVIASATWLYPGEAAGPHELRRSEKHLKLAYAFSAVAILADIILLIIPICLFWRLQVELRTKVALIVLCCLGVL